MRPRQDAERKAERKRREEEIEKAATALYDTMNPRWDVEIIVSKAKCLRMARKALRLNAGAA